MIKDIQAIAIILNGLIFEQERILISNDSTLVFICEEGSIFKIEKVSKEAKTREIAYLSLVD